MNALKRLNRPVFALVAVTLLAGGLRLWHLSYPNEYVFDEIYYAKSGCLYAGYSPSECDVSSTNEKYWYKLYGDVGDWVHPPLGKEMIGLGERFFGNNSFGWRIAAAVAGTATVFFAALIAQLLFRKPVWTFVAGLLLAVESLNLVQSRVALLDIFLAFWVVLGFLFVILDRRWIKRKTDAANAGTEPGETTVLGRVLAASQAPDPGGTGQMALPPPPPPLTPWKRVPSPLWRPWRFAAGIAFGAAFATKWSGATAAAGAILLMFIWERTRRSSAGQPHPVWRALYREGFGIVVAMVLVPLAVYLMAYTRYWIHYGVHPMTFLHLQGAMEQFHRTLGRFKPNTKLPELTHPYESEPWSWPLMLRPVDFYFKDPGSQILSIGNPVIFWGSIVAVPYMALVWWKRRDARAGFIFVAVMCQWLPWFLIMSRVQFFFYMTPITPFMVLAMTYSLKDLSEAHLSGSKSRAFLPVAAGVVILAVALFVFFWPILTAGHLSHSQWQARMWKSSWI